MVRTLALAMIMSSPALASIVTKNVAYTANEKTQLEGVLVYDDAVKTPRPGLVLVPNWLGINAPNIEQAKLVAGSKYVVFVADMYGKDGRPKGVEDAPKIAGAVRGDPKLMRARVFGALETLKAQKVPGGLDTKKLGAIGFCFGGTGVLELARAGGDVAGVVSFHGGLAPLMPDQPAKSVKAKILALHGAEDPAVPPKDVEAFENELRGAKADWQLVKYGNSVHSFTDPDAKNPGRNEYNPTTAKRAYAAMNAFFDELFGG